MFKPILTVAALGVAGIIVWKFAWGLLFPVVGVAVSLAVWAIKLALLALVVYVIYRIVRAGKAEAGRDG